MTAPTPNAELAYKVLDLTKAHPTHFDMGEWSSGLVDLAALTAEPSCGTTACFAGWTVAQAGYRVHISGHIYRAEDAVYIVTSEIDRFAADLLGITEEQAEELFFVADDRIDEAVAEIFGPRPDAAS